MVEHRPRLSEKNPRDVALDAEEPPGRQLPIVTALQAARCSQVVAWGQRETGTVIRIEVRPVGSRLPCAAEMSADIDAAPAIGEVGGVA
jgi:hypothetical protein